MSPSAGLHGMSRKSSHGNVLGAQTYREFPSKSSLIQSPMYWFTRTMMSTGPQCPLWHGQYLPIPAGQPAQGAIPQLQNARWAQIRTKWVCQNIRVFIWLVPKKTLYHHLLIKIWRHKWGLLWAALRRIFSGFLWDPSMLRHGSSQLPTRSFKLQTWLMTSHSFSLRQLWISVSWLF